MERFVEKTVKCRKCGIVEKRQVSSDMTFRIMSHGRCGIVRMDVVSVKPSENN